jgi:hypothetical protein
VGKRSTGSLAFLVPLLGLAVAAGWKWAVGAGVVG